jgi:hypothetical protein
MITHPNWNNINTGNQEPETALGEMSHTSGHSNLQLAEDTKSV